MAQVLQTRMVGYATDSTRHVMAPPEVVYEVEAPPPRKAIPLKAKLWGIYIIVMLIYGAIQSTINTFN